MSTIIGIDLGTTNSCVVVMEGETPVVLPNAEGSRTTPSIVAFVEDAQVLVGHQAKRQSVINPDRTITHAKRLMGRQTADPAIEEFRRYCGYDTFSAPNGDCWVRAGGADRSPQEISALILRKLKQTAEDYLGHEVTEAVVTVPAYFTDAQRQATREAGTLAGLKVRRILNEPTAAALAYGIHKPDACLAVFDLGGGTFDVSILRVRNGVFEVIATAGDADLGGDDFDRVLLEALLDDFESENGIDLRQDRMAVQRLKEAAETAKCELSTITSTTISLPFLAVNESGPKHLNTTLGRDKLENLADSLIRRLEAPCRRALSDAGLKPSDIDEVLLVGGMSRMPAVQRKVEELFGRRPSKGVNPDEAVAIGASIQGGVLSGEVQEVILLDVTPHSLGIRVQGGRMSTVIPRNTTVPVRHKKTFATTEDMQTEVILHVLQGEDAQASNNVRLGTFSLDRLEPRKAGEVRVDVTFEINADGIVNVSAVDSVSGKQAHITIQNAHGLNAAERDTAAARVQAVA
ncbi:MAG: molecular chaperone DnaK [Deltaproteobacteria bacterium]|nr:MAG: molecular chaperone DnaK [Deltaproteobacteria bacterium]